MNSRGERWSCSSPGASAPSSEPRGGHLETGSAGGAGRTSPRRSRARRKPWARSAKPSTPPTPPSTRSTSRARDARKKHSGGQSGRVLGPDHELRRQPRNVAAPAEQFVRVPIGTAPERPSTAPPTTSSPPSRPRPAATTPRRRPTSPGSWRTSSTRTGSGMKSALSLSEAISPAGTNPTKIGSATFRSASGRPPGSRHPGVSPNERKLRYRPEPCWRSGGWRERIPGSAGSGSGLQRLRRVAGAESRPGIGPREDCPCSGISARYRPPEGRNSPPG